MAKKPAPTKMTLQERVVLREVAHWCDVEYQLLCMVPTDKPEGYDAQILSGRKAMLADLAAGLRTWSTSGKPPDHQKVRTEWRAAYARLVREEGEG